MTDRVSIASPTISEQTIERVSEVMRSGRLADGDEVRAFEDAFASYCDCRHGVATTNGTTALHAALEGAGIGEGDRVLTTPFSFIATANAVRLAGAEPVFADIDPETYNLDPETVADVATETDIDALLPVHLYGHPAPMEELNAIAARYDLAVIEDAAQAHGATLDGRPVGSFGDAACFSFYPTKNMTTGEGGMVVTDDPDLADRTRRFVNHGRTDGYEHAEIGHNFRMTNIAAAVGIEQLDRLEGFVEARRHNANVFERHLAELAPDHDFLLPVERPGAKHVYHQYTLRTSHRDKLSGHLDDRAIDSAVYYPIPIHEQPAYDDVDSDNPIAERIADEVLSVPVHPGLSDHDVRRVASVVAEYARTTPR